MLALMHLETRHVSVSEMKISSFLKVCHRGLRLSFALYFYHVIDILNTMETESYK